MAQKLSFSKSLKSRAVEEWLDIVFFRRLAHFLVPIFIKLKITPNQVSTLSMSMGLMAAYCVLKQYFIISALLAIVAIIFDCCDGQIARLTGQASPIGRTVDGVSDFIWVASFWFGIFFSGYFQLKGYKVLPLMIVSGASSAIHIWRYDGAKVLFQDLTNPVADSQVDIHDALKWVKDSFKKFDLIGAILSLCMAFQLYFFVRGGKEKKKYELKGDQKAEVLKTLEPVMRAWTWMGESHHNTVLIIGVLFLGLTPYVLFTVWFYILIPLNIYYIVLEVLWYKRVSKIKKKYL